MFSKKKRNDLQKKENQKHYLWKTITLLKINKKIRALGKMILPGTHPSRMASAVQAAWNGATLHEQKFPNLNLMINPKRQQRFQQQNMKYILCEED